MTEHSPIRTAALDVIDVAHMTREVVSRVRQHFTGLILSTMRRACKGTDVTIHYGQQNGAYGVHQALVKLDGDDTDYRLILAPANAPITINGQTIDGHFLRPLAEVAA